MSSKDKTFSPTVLAESLSQLPPVRAYRVALSGGADSVALLHALSQIQSKLNVPVSAIHINHGLQIDSSRWTAQCERLCGHLNIPLNCVKVDAQRHSRESVEMAARRARYAALSEWLGEGEALLTAHHRNDQAETLLLNLLKGAGSAGLAAMPASRNFASGYLFRPLLAISREQIIAYLKKHHLDWIEDPSNDDIAFDRNYLRHEILPRLEKRWLAAVKGIARSAGHQQEQLELRQALAKNDLQDVADFVNAGVDIQKLKELSHARQKNVLKYWLETVGSKVSAEEVQIATIRHEILAADEDSQPELTLGQTRIRRDQNTLIKEPVSYVEVPENAFAWPLNKSLVIAKAGLKLEPEPLLNHFKAFNKSTELTVRFRQGGERFKPAGKKHHRKLKQLFQEWRVPVWRRDRIPLIYWQDQLIVVWGYGSVESVKDE